jgi:hypothetical protein
VPQDQQEKLVGKIADNLLMAVNAIMEEEEPMTVEEDEVDENDEKILWKGRPFLSLVENYTVTTERLKIITGLMARHVENFELIRIQDIDFKQGMTERMFGIGDITIRGHDPSNPEIKLRNVSKPEEVTKLCAEPGWKRASVTGCNSAVCRPGSGFRSRKIDNTHSRAALGGIYTPGFES